MKIVIGGIIGWIVGAGLGALAVHSSSSTPFETATIMVGFSVIGISLGVGVGDLLF